MLLNGQYLLVREICGQSKNSGKLLNGINFPDNQNRKGLFSFFKKNVNSVVALWFSFPC